MSLLNYIATKIKNRIITFINVVTLANREYPYEDFVTIDDGEEPTVYQVGEHNRRPDGSQSKLFVAKSTLMLSDVACTVRFNDARSVTHTLRANQMYEFMQNIWTVHVVTIATGGYLDIHCEGVLSDEARRAE